MDSSRPTLPHEGTIWNHNGGSSVESEGPSPPPSWGMNSYGSNLPKEGSSLSFNGNSFVRNEGTSPLPSWEMNSYRSALPKEGPTWSFNAGSSIQGEGLSSCWGIDSYGPTLPKEEPTLSFNVDSSVGSEGPSHLWDMHSYKPTLPKEGQRQSFNTGSSVGSQGPPSFWGMDCYKPTLPKEGTTSFNVGSAVESEGPLPPPSEAIENLKSQVGTILNSNSQVDSSWTEDSFTRLLLEYEGFNFDSSPWHNNLPSLEEPVRDGSAAATVSICNQISPPRSEVGASSCGTNSFQFSKATPDHMRQLDTHYHFDMLNWSTASQEKDRHASLLSVPAENVVCNTSAVTVSAEQFTDRTILQKEGDQVINLNKTPKQTTPRRRKHKPKVIIEEKPQRTPKAVEALKNENPPAVKRKYVRKNNLTQMEVGSTSKEKQSGKRKYVRKNGPPPIAKRSLNFDLGKDQSLKVGEASSLSGQRYEVVNQASLDVANLNATARSSNHLKTGPESLMKMRTENGFQTAPSSSRTLLNTHTVGSSSGPSTSHMFYNPVCNYFGDRSTSLNSSIFDLNVESNLSEMPDLNQPWSINKKGLQKGKTTDIDSIETTSRMPLVPYKGDGAVVPCERVNIGKKKFSLPEVDLEPETDRAWQLLMGSEANEAEDEKREKWWEAERKVFQGRIESFTARMHLIQGDRRFSRWKGSVLDSVIGVFLTQNVSDHLSSSAFMSLVAKFPNHRENKVQTCFKSETNVDKSGLFKNVPMDSDEVLSWSLPKSKGETSRTCIPTKDGDRIGKEFSWLEKSNNPQLTSTAGTFLGTPFSPSMPTIPEKVTGDFKLFANETNYFMDPEWPSVSYKANGIHKQEPSMQQHKIVDKEPSRHKKDKAFDWDRLGRQLECNTRREHRCCDALDSLDFDALRRADVKEISNAIKARGFNNMLAGRMKAFLDRVMSEHGSMDLEWLRDAPQDIAKEYLISIKGIGLKSTECVRLLTLHHRAFPVDTNVGRIAVRLGWVPLRPLPESLQLHLLKEYPVLDSIQKYLWPRLCKLDQPTLYELHYQMITFGKVFCTKSKPNCNVCPMRGDCRHFASAFASARLALPGLEERRIVTSVVPTAIEMKQLVSASNSIPFTESGYIARNCEPIVEEPATPEPERNEVTESDMEDAFNEDSDDIPTIKLNLKEFTHNLHSYMQGNMELQGCDLSRALVVQTPDIASIPSAKLKNVSRLRTEHLVYELPDSHPLLEKLDRREQDDPSPYLLAIWTPGETACSTKLPERNCRSHESSSLCTQSTCLYCNSIREADKQIVRGTLLVPCRTAMMGSFPLNGTYFQVNEMFADHESSINPISVPRSLIWNLPRKTVYFGTSVTSIFKGMSLEEIQKCFWRGFVCVRGFDQKTRTPRPLIARLHFPASKLVKKKNDNKNGIPS